MKAVILAGGYGTRLAEESVVRPKPMVEIGGRPILWHIMKIYSAHGINDFIICLGYKGYVIKEYFANYFMHTSDVTIDLERNSMEVHRRTAEPWRVTLIDTGDGTLTGGRLKRVSEYLDPGEDFCFTYGDGVSDVDISKLVDFHGQHKQLVTLTAVQQPGRFGSVQIEGNSVSEFIEKPRGDGVWINGGFFVCSTGVLDHIAGDRTSFETDTLRAIASQNQLAAFRHEGFWQPMDTMRDKDHLERLWSGGQAPWRIWT